MTENTSAKSTKSTKSTKLVKRKAPVKKTTAPKAKTSKTSKASRAPKAPKKKTTAAKLTKTAKTKDTPDSREAAEQEARDNETVQNFDRDRIAELSIRVHQKMVAENPDLETVELDPRRVLQLAAQTCRELEADSEGTQGFQELSGNERNFLEALLQGSLPNLPNLPGGVQSAGSLNEILQMAPTDLAEGRRRQARVREIPGISQLQREMRQEFLRQTNPGRGTLPPEEEFTEENDLGYGGPFAQD